MPNWRDITVWCRVQLLYFTQEDIRLLCHNVCCLTRDNLIIEAYTVKPPLHDLQIKGQKVKHISQSQLFE